jgi:hypothetical protein
MFLPVLLVRDYGIWGWIVFAVPNVIGAATMGWVIRTQRHNDELVRAHRAACQSFSFVTIAFHTFFTFWMMRLFRMPWPVVLFPVVFFMMPAMFGVRSRGNIVPPTFHLTLAAVVLLWSLITLALWIFYAGWHTAPLRGFSPSLASLAPVSVFGFLLCPHLDLTFHRARSSMTYSQSRMAFTIGFAVFFLAMIFFTLLYSRTMLAVISGMPIVGTLATLLFAHFAGQIGYTVGVHGQTLLKQPHPASFLVALVVGIGAGMFGSPGTFRNLDRGEAFYRLFMAFYGLVFPAYVWLCMIPTWKTPTTPTHRPLTVLAITVLLAAPFYWMGFIEQKMLWLAPGLAIVLLARLAIRRETKEHVPEVAALAKPRH